MNKEKCNELITDRMMWNNEYCFGEDPMIEEHFWIPLSDELSKNVDETIDFWRTLTVKEFEISLECLDEIIQKTQSKKLLEAVRTIGKEKSCNMKKVESRIKSAECWLEDDE